MAAIESVTIPERERAAERPPSAFRRIRNEIQTLGLEPYVGRLEMEGYCVVPPDMMLKPGQLDVVRERILDWAEQCHGERPDLDSDETTAFQVSGFGDTMPTILGFDPMFEDLLMHPVVMAFATWLTGYSTTLNYFGPSIKGPGGAELNMHTDGQLISQAPGPLPPFSLAANCTLAVTDFTAANGCTVIVPGSHKRCLWASGPISNEPDATPVECPAGSLIVWHGNTWHGAMPRTNPGKRVSLLMYFTRHWLRPRENWDGKLAPASLERHPRLAVVTGQGLPFDYASYDEFTRRVIRNAAPTSTVDQAERMSLWT
jgi:hypothetical protein